jgi:mannose-6-phosphate isomerase-like protein (cupin superfamily)
VKDVFQGDIKKLARENKNFRKVIYTGEKSQLVLMSIPSKVDIGMEVHDGVDQILFFVDGSCEATVSGKSWNVNEGDVVFVPAGAQHNFMNAGMNDLKLYTVYSPPEHADGTVHMTKADAMKEHEE